jgi:phospholipase/lecithinase/hemolysin
MRTTWNTIAATLIAGFLAGAATPASAGYASLTVFGDSLSDGGNVYTLTGNTFPPTQRFTNGPTAVEQMAAALGLPLTPSLLGGSNYAYGGAETGTGSYLGLDGTGVLAQVSAFVNAPPPGFGGPASLIVLWAGPNDLFTAFASGVDPASIILPAMDNLAASVALLYGAGARTILMPDLPNMGATPFGLGSGNPAGLTAFSAGFNSALALTADGLEGALPGLNLIEFSTFALLDRVIADPGAFGFANVEDPCFNGFSVCANPDDYLFWDSVHPTARGHALLGASFAAAVPEPGSLQLIAGALLIIGGLRRRVAVVRTRR